MSDANTNHGKRATIRGVAHAAGVSIATVSRVLNGRPDVAPDTREAVMRAVREQGFSTNRNARALSGGRTGLIGVTIPLVEAAYFGIILSGGPRLSTSRTCESSSARPFISTNAR